MDNSFRILRRDYFREDGIFSTLITPDNCCIARTLEHAFPDGKGSFLPALPNGEYICVLGAHKLEGMEKPFQTYEVTGVKGHSGILFHPGNYNRDSKGCILPGYGIGEDCNGAWMVLTSRITFNAIMVQLAGVSQFTLKVI